MRSDERGVERSMRDLGDKIEVLYADAEALEEEAREKRRKAETLEKELRELEKEAERRRRYWPTEPEEIRCFCGQPLVAYRPPPVGSDEPVGRRLLPPVFELPGPTGRPLTGVCPACRADLEVVLAELAASPAQIVPPGQLALPVGG